MSIIFPSYIPCVSHFPWDFFPCLFLQGHQWFEHLILRLRPVGADDAGVAVTRHKKNIRYTHIITCSIPIYKLSSGKHSHNDGKITICNENFYYFHWAMLNGNVKLPEGIGSYWLYHMVDHMKEGKKSPNRIKLAY